MPGGRCAVACATRCWAASPWSSMRRPAGDRITMRTHAWTYRPCRRGNATMSERREPRDALLVLADGAVFEGEAIGADLPVAAGEVVFNTVLSGYQEVLTDPSYAG